MVGKLLSFDRAAEVLCPNASFGINSCAYHSLEQELCSLFGPDNGGTGHALLSPVFMDSIAGRKTLDSRINTIVLIRLY
jgi:hypothetical protein